MKDSNGEQKKDRGKEKERRREGEADIDRVREKNRQRVCVREYRSREGKEERYHRKVNIDQNNETAKK